jgi:uncharacterized protein (UPF0297 family)
LSEIFSRKIVLDHFVRKIVQDNLVRKIVQYYFVRNLVRKIAQDHFVRNLVRKIAQDHFVRNFVRKIAQDHFVRKIVQDHFVRHLALTPHLHFRSQRRFNPMKKMRPFSNVSLILFLKTVAVFSGKTKKPNQAVRVPL